MKRFLIILLLFPLYLSCSKEDEEISYDGYVTINKQSEIPIIDIYEEYETRVVVCLKDGSYISIIPGETEDVLPTMSAGYKHTIVNVNYGSGGAYVAQRGKISVSKTTNGYKILGNIELDNFDILNIRYGID